MAIEHITTSNPAYDRQAINSPVQNSDFKAGNFDAMLKNSTGEVVVQHNISYGADEKKIMDIYQPVKKTTEKIPIVLFLVGGGDSKGHPSMQALGQGFAENGIAMISPDYGKKYLDKMDNIESILRYIKDHAVENNWDLNNITVAGGSAGAHAVMQYAMNPRFYGNTSNEIRIRNVIGYAPPTNLHLDDDKYPGDHKDRTANMLGISNVPKGHKDRFNNNRVRDEASPTTYADNKELHNKRFFLTYGDDDLTTTIGEQVDPFITRMISGGQNITLDKPHPNGGHGHWLLQESKAYDPGFVGRMSTWILEDTPIQNSTILDSGEGLQSGIEYFDRQIKNGENISLSLDAILYEYGNSVGVMEYINHLKRTNPSMAEKYFTHLYSEVSNSTVEVFDAEYYAINNPDLKENNVDTDSELKEHWLVYGINEGRVGAADADYRSYLKNNAGSIPKNIDTQIEALRYFKQHG